jgi:hypothetical protein
MRIAGYADVKLAGRRRNVERRGPREHIRGYLMRAITGGSPMIGPSLLQGADCHVRAI